MKKFIALALALAMMVSCLVFTASANSGVAVTLQGPTAVEAGATFQVKVRVTDAQNIVGGVQGLIDVTGAEVVDVQVNPQLQTWNKTSDNNTIYKLTDNDITFAALNDLAEDTEDTRLWFMVDYKVTDAAAVSVELKNVKVSDKAATLVSDVALTNLAVDVVTVNPETDPVITLDKYGMRNKSDDVLAQEMAVQAGISFPSTENIAEVGVVFYPTALLEGAALTVETPGAIFAKANKAENAALFRQITTGNTFNGLLKYGFTSKTNALKFLGTKVTARVYYITTDGDVVYSANASENKYIRNGVGNKAALNSFLDNGDAVTDVKDGYSKEDYNTAKAKMNTNDSNWEANREYVLKYAINNNK